MKKPAILLFTVLTSCAFVFAGTKKEIDHKGNFTTPAPDPATGGDPSAENESSALYTDMHLETIGVKPKVFSAAMEGFQKLISKEIVRNNDIITIADFSQPSNNKRLYVLDVKNKKVLFNTLVAHGKNTGTLWARSFSNDASSLKSSPGFYVTSDTYTGHNGYSLRLNGLERNINDNALARAVVLHGAPYVDKSSVSTLGFLGRSWGCPAVPLSQHKAIINTIKDGSCFFIYTTENNYLYRSTILNS